MFSSFLENRVIAFVPAFNEAPSVGAVVAGLKAHGIDVLVIDDASNDATRDEALSAGAQVISFDVNRGVAAAIQEALKFAGESGYDFVLQCDGDGQHPPEFAGLLISEAARSSCDLLIGNRYSAAENRHTPGLTRLIVIRLLRLMVKKKSGAVITDVTSGYRVFSRRLALQLAMDFPGYFLGDTFEVLVIAARQGYRVREIPVPMKERFAGLPSTRGIGAAIPTMKAILRVATGRTISISSATK